MELGGTGVPAPPCLKIGNYRFSSAFTIAVVAGQEAGHGLSATSVDFLVEHAAHLLSLAGGQRHFPPPLASGDAKEEPAAWADSSFGDVLN